MDIKGTITKILPPTGGVSSAGREWKKQEFVIDYIDGSFTRQVCFTLFGDKVNLLAGFQPGMEVAVSFQVESREFQGKWFTNVNAWRLQSPEQAVAAATSAYTAPMPPAYAAPLPGTPAPANNPVPQSSYTPPSSPYDFPADNGDDPGSDLPF
ncbi:MAG: DUF3127 domain-containing protein [Bacteroidales bacterium]|jgi:hypothetical protein|nr:DUF3127 domain-containing protein [Bacteroidales bacterium]